MAGITSTLSIAKTAVATQQYGLNVTGQNIANVNNPDYSVQTAEHKNRTPASYGGFLFGTGVEMEQIQQSVDKLLEERLTNEISLQSSFDEQESYMRILESYFDVSSETSITSVMTEFWNSWHDLSNNPNGSSERVSVFEVGKKLSGSFESTVLSLDALSNDVDLDIDSAVIRVNSLSEQIARLNVEIAGNELSRTANDQRDQRNRLLDELGDLVDVSIYEHSDGTITVNAANSFSIISGADTVNLKTTENDVVWEGSSSGDTIITDKIISGRIGGLIEMRDAVIPKYRAEVNELSREMIWAINYQHSQGTGLEYISEPVTGDYTTDDSRWISSFHFGDKLDSSKDFTMWMEDTTTSTTEYNKIDIDMDVSDATITNWQGVAPGSLQYKYQLTVVDDGVLGDKQVTETDGDGLARVWGLTVSPATATTVAMTLDQAIAEQTLRVYNGPDGTQIINVMDSGGQARRSAASVAEALNAISGVEAFASETNVTFDTGSITNADNGDEVQFSLYVDGLLETVSFVRDSSIGTLQEQFEDALLTSVESINNTNDDDDLKASGLTITSSAGKTLGVEDFNVIDNAGVALSNFSNFNEGDTVTFTIDSMTGTSAADTTNISVDLDEVDINDQVELINAFGNELISVLDSSIFTVVKDFSTNTIKIRTIDGTDIRLRDAGSDTDNNATIDLASLTGTTADGGNVDNILDFTAAANDEVQFNASTSAADDLGFTSQGTTATINESTAGAVNKTAVITGTLTVVLEPGMDIRTTVSGAGSGGLFDSSLAKVGSSILTLGGDGGFSGFNATTAAGETISFDIDGTTITFNTSAAGGTSDIALATLIETELNAALGTNYEVVRTASSVSIIKAEDQDDPIVIDNFTDSFNSNATINIRTGTGTGTNQPENDMIDTDPTQTFRNSSTSTLYSDEAIIMWERLDTNGIRTGASGLVHVEDAGSAVITESGVDTLTFDISEGKLVAGNTLLLNTDTSGRPDPLNFTVTGQANSINDIYRFRVVSGGKVGEEPSGTDPDITIEWTNSVESGSFTIEGSTPPITPDTPVEISVDGMNLRFFDGTLLEDDVFTITIGDGGLPMFETASGDLTGEKMADWHWTIDSFADEFNRIAPGVKATATLDNRLKFEASDEYYTMRNVEYSGENGFDDENVTVAVTNWEAVNFQASDLRFERSAAGVWGYLNDPTGGALELVPEGGDDDGFGVDFTGDGLADIKIEFKERVTGYGYVEFDLQRRNMQDIGFAFSDSDSQAAGLVAAAGINTFFEGYNSLTMGVNEKLSDTRLIGAATINSETGEISQGDNTNSLAMADVQFQELQMKLWTYRSGVDPQSSITNASLDDFYTQMVGSLGIKSRSIKNSKEFADIMVNNITEQRNSISSVSLDEEMIRLMKFQHAFSAASKLLTVSDEMLNTLISMR